MTDKVSLSSWHDASIALVKDGNLELLLESERFSHVKHDKMSNQCMEEFGDLENAPHAGMDLDSTHHVYHAAHSFYDSGFKEAVCVIVDGMGSEVSLDDSRFKEGTYGRESISIYKLTYPLKIDLVYRYVSVPFDNSITLNNGKTRPSKRISPALMFQKTCTAWGMNWYDAGKLMAMSAYSSNDVDYDTSIFEIDENDIREVTLKPEFNTFEEKADFCKWLQKYSQEYVRRLVVQAVELSGCNNVCLSGGYFLNCVSNSYIRKNLPKDIKIFIEPICGDNGVAIGLAKLCWYDETKSRRINPLKTVYNGVKREIDVEGEKTTFKEIAQLLSEGKVVSIFQSRSECGPRALGNRSILYDPRDPDGRNKINTLKRREDYRPLAATVLYEHAKKWFDMSFIDESPYMLYNFDVLSDKIPAICHVDNTCRIQTLKKPFNKNFYQLIYEFYRLTGVPLLLNTSFNLAGDTIVETVEDAINTLNKSDIDYLYFPEKQIIL